MSAPAGPQLVEDAGADIQVMDLVRDHPRRRRQQGGGRVEGGQLGGDVGGARHAAPLLVRDPLPAGRHADQQAGGVP